MSRFSRCVEGQQLLASQLIWGGCVYTTTLVDILFSLYVHLNIRTCMQLKTLSSGPS